MIKLDEQIQKILNEFAFPTNKVRSRVIDLSVPIMMHLLKLILCLEKSPSTKHHWCHELANFLNQCSVMQIKGKGFPTADQLHTWLLTGFADYDEISGIYRLLENQYGKFETSIEDAYTIAIEKLDVLLKYSTDFALTDEVAETIFVGDAK